MTVADLIEVLKTQEPNATVVLWDNTTYGGQVSKLGFGGVRPIELGARDCNGLLLLEAWVDGDAELQGPHAGVVLGFR